MRWKKRCVVVPRGSGLPRPRRSGLLAEAGDGIRPGPPGAGGKGWAASFPSSPSCCQGLTRSLGFLFLNTWVDLRRDLTAPEAVDALASAVRDVGARQETVPVAVCPYRSLRAFQEEHAAFFFGREAFADRLRDAVLGRKLVAVVGPSGSGKSSVVQAGLFPLLRRQRPPARTWDAVSFTPGKQPFHRLAAALIPLLEPGLSETDRLTEAQKLGDRLACGEVHVEATIEHLVIKSVGTDRLLVVADQFEELFTQTPEAARWPFVEAVLGALDRAPLTLMLTLRADFYGHVIALSRELSDRVEQTVVNLGPMRREELEQAIVEPARRVGLAFELGLADRILDDVGEEPGHLPLLEFALTELWAQREVKVLTHAALSEHWGGGWRHRPAGGGRICEIHTGSDKRSPGGCLLGWCGWRVLKRGRRIPVNEPHSPNSPLARSWTKRLRWALSCRP